MKVLKLLIMAIAINASLAQLSAKDIKYAEETLDNGLQVIYHIDRTAPVVSTVVHYKVGAKDEVVGKTGYAHFFEHLMFEATDNIGRSDISKYINEAGGWLNAHTSWDETVYKFKVPSHELKLALWIEAERMRNLQIESIGVETQRGVVIEEKKSRVDNQPYGTMIEKMVENLFVGATYSWPTIGSIEDLNQAKIEDFQNFYDNFYKPNNAVLVISGDLQISDAQNAVKEFFGDMPLMDVPLRKQYDIRPLEVPYRETVPDDKAQLPALFMGYRSPSLGDPDYYAFNLLSNILAAGESSRLYNKIVNEEQLALAVQMSPLSLEKDGAVIFVGVAKPGEDLDEIEEAIVDEINELIEDGITEEELQKTKNIMESQMIFSKKNVLDKAMALARYKAYYGDASLINEEIKRYMEVKPDDIINVAKKYLSTDSKVVLNYVPQAN